MKKSLSTAVIGIQAGDEGKGAIVDELLDSADAVVRFNGGPNAGHTLVLPNGKKEITHNLPSGIVREGMINIVSKGVACDPKQVEAELEIAQAYKSHVYIDACAPVILDEFKKLDSLSTNDNSSTKRGINRVFGNFAARLGVLVGDLSCMDTIRDRLEYKKFHQELQQQARAHGVWFSGVIEALHRIHARASCFTGAHITDTTKLIYQLLEQDKTIVFEGAQGMEIDLYGPWPYVTSSLCGVAGISATCGVFQIPRVIGVIKAYKTKVGAGHFPTKLEGDIGAELREKGGEYGATTGRPRDCGWLDLVSARAAIMRSGVTEIAITKLDVLSGMKEVKVAIEYQMKDGNLLSRHASITSEVLREAKPIYSFFEGWKEDISGVTEFKDLPDQAKNFVYGVQEFLGVPVSLVRVGPKRGQMFEVS